MTDTSHAQTVLASLRNCAWDVSVINHGNPGEGQNDGALAWFVLVISTEALFLPVISNPPSRHLERSREIFPSARNSLSDQKGLL